MNERILRAKTLKEQFQYVLAIITVIVFFVLLGLMLFKAVPEANDKLLYIAVGALIGIVQQVINYYFGSSKSSSEKTEIIANGKKQSSNELNAVG